MNESYVLSFSQEEWLLLPASKREEIKDILQEVYGEERDMRKELEMTLEEPILMNDLKEEGILNEHGNVISSKKLVKYFDDLEDEDYGR